MEVNLGNAYPTEFYRLKCIEVDFWNGGSRQNEGLTCDTIWGNIHEVRKVIFKIPIIFRQSCARKADFLYVWLLPQKRILAPKISFSFFFFFFFFVGKNLLLHVVMLENVADRGFLAFWPFENEWKFRKSVKSTQKIWNLAKSEYYPPRHNGAVPLYLLCTACHSISNTSTTTGTSPTTPWNVRKYHYHTSNYADHQFPIINTNRFIVHRCEFDLYLNWTVLFICFITKHGTAPGLQIIINE